MAVSTLVSLKRVIEVYPLPPTDGSKFSRDDWANWVLDSLIFGFDALEKGRPHEALRGLLQAHEYVGRIGGFWPCALAHDAAIELQNELEDLIKHVKASSKS